MVLAEQLRNIRDNSAFTMAHFLHGRDIGNLEDVNVIRHWLLQPNWGADNKILLQAVVSCTMRLKPCFERHAVWIIGKNASL